MATCTVSGTFVDSSSTAVNAVIVKFRVITPLLDPINQLVLPTEISTTSGSNGFWSLAIDQGITGLLSFDYPPSIIAPTRRTTYSVAIPATTSASFASIMPTEV